MRNSATLNAEFLPNPHNQKAGVGRVDAMEALDVMKATCVDIVDSNGRVLRISKITVRGGAAKIVVDTA